MAPTPICSYMHSYIQPSVHTWHKDIRPSPTYKYTYWHIWFDCIHGNIHVLITFWLPSCTFVHVVLPRTFAPGIQHSPGRRCRMPSIAPKAATRDPVLSSRTSMLHVLPGMMGMTHQDWRVSVSLFLGGSRFHHCSKPYLSEVHLWSWWNRPIEQMCSIMFSHQKADREHFNTGNLARSFGDMYIYLYTQNYIIHEYYIFINSC